MLNTEGDAEMILAGPLPWATCIWGSGFPSQSKSYSGLNVPSVPTPPPPINSLTSPTILPFTICVPTTPASLLIWKHPVKLPPQGFYSVGPSTWNTHPAYICMAHCLTNFRSLVKCYLLNKAFPSHPKTAGSIPTFTVSSYPINFSLEHSSPAEILYLPILLIFCPPSGSSMNVAT